MPEINLKQFFRGLDLTRAYCNYISDLYEACPATMFRTFNPEMDGQPLFKFDNLVAEGNNSYFSTSWAVDPLGPEQDRLLPYLLEQQLQLKAACPCILGGPFTGDILIAQIGCTVGDGASEAASHGFIDIFDLPPLDTWFYITKDSSCDLLFAWIPDSWQHYVRRGIEVNPLDCLGWYRDFYPREYKGIMSDRYAPNKYTGSN